MKSRIKSNISKFNHGVFRAYDIRGIVDEELDTNILYDIGLALGSEVISKGLNKIVVGRDGRISGPMLMGALKDGIQNTGCDIVDIGVVPTPVLYFATYIYDIPSGVMLTGSHNPANYNGVKMVVAGNTLATEEIQALKNRILSGNLSYGLGSIVTKDINNKYISYIKNNLNIQRKLKIVIDAGNGVTGAIAPQLFRSLGCEVIELYCEVDGTFPNHHPDPSKPDNLKELISIVAQENADIGLAFDGDGDRLGVVTNHGEIIYADRQLMLYAREVLKERPGGSIVYDVKCTNNLSKYISDFSGTPIMAKTGHALIKKKIKEVGAILAGEMSGHTFFNDRWFGFDDGLYTGARLIEILSKTDLNSDNLFKEIPQSFNTPEINISVCDSYKFKLIEKLLANVHSQFPTAKLIDIDGLRIEFSDGWGLVRASNTTPCIVLRFEADNKNSLARIQDEIMRWVNSYI